MARAGAGEGPVALRDEGAMLRLVDATAAAVEARAAAAKAANASAIAATEAILPKLADQHKVRVLRIRTT